MIITLNNQRVDGDFAAGSTLLALINEVRVAHGNPLIVSVCLNGQRLGEAELEAALAQPVADSAQIDLESGNPHELVGDAIRGLARAFADARARQAAIAEQLDAGVVSEAVQSVGPYITLWQTCSRVLVQCGNLVGDDLMQREHQGCTVQTWLRNALPKLSEIRDALEARDMTLLADLVRYEIPGLCGTWEELLTDIAGQIAAPAAP